MNVCCRGKSSGERRCRRASRLLLSNIRQRAKLFAPVVGDDTNQLIHDTSSSSASQSYLYRFYGYLSRVTYQGDPLEIDIGEEAWLGRRCRPFFFVQRIGGAVSISNVTIMEMPTSHHLLLTYTILVFWRIISFSGGYKPKLNMTEYITQSLIRIKAHHLLF